MTQGIDLRSEALERTKRIFRFLKAFSERNVPIRRALGEQPWVMLLRDLPQHPCIQVGSVFVNASTNGNGELESDTSSEALIRVTRPTLTRAPQPPRSLDGWLKVSWEVSDGAVSVEPSRNRVGRNGETVVEQFEDDTNRVESFEQWKQTWESWAQAERPARKAMRVFEKLYALRGQIELESERVELMLGDGRLRWRTAEGIVDHPILLQRMELVFDPDVPEFRVVDSDHEPELYGAVLQAGEAISGEKLNELRQELEKGGYHPLSADGTTAYLKRLAFLLGPEGDFSESPSDGAIGAEPLIARDPALFLRARSSGFPAAFDRVLEDLENDPKLPPSLVRVVGIEPSQPDDDHGQAYVSPWGEPHDVLLSKLANPEQVQIARALERHRAVLVQGPPGTGKSHTIANLIGHFVAQGKRVLVTSHTTKALRVLRNHVVEELRPLCVAVLENDDESRAQMEQAVRGIVGRLTTSTEAELESEVEQLSRTREKLLGEVEQITSDIRAVMEAEYVPIVLDGRAIRPSDAARGVEAKRAAYEWLPGPVSPDGPLPLSDQELRELYETNIALASAEELELSAALPDRKALLSPSEFEQALASLGKAPSDSFARFWERAPLPHELGILTGLLQYLTNLEHDLTSFEQWQKAVVSAGYAGDADRDLWLNLKERVLALVDRFEKGRELLLEHSPEIEARGSIHDIREPLSEILTHLGSGGSLGRLTLLFRPQWKSAIQSCRVNGVKPSKPVHFEALLSWLQLEDGRAAVAERWRKQAVPAGFPEVSAFPSPPEPVLREYVSSFNDLLQWWPERWKPLEQIMKELGFRWSAFRQQELAKAPLGAAFDREARFVTGSFRQAVDDRLVSVCRLIAKERLEGLQNGLRPYHGPVCSMLNEAVRRREVENYRSAFRELEGLILKHERWTRRRDLLDRLASAAAAWVEAIRRRSGIHGAGIVPEGAREAWRWRQLCQELERRTALDERQLTGRLTARRDELRQTTARLIDRKAWLAQLHRTGLEARQALIGWSTTQKRIGKGTGKRVPELQRRARELLSKARDAVPVWIMPLARVAESFDPRAGKFDVVIVDEASQCDVTGLLACYMGKQVAIVGDHEQVSPLAVGQRIEDTKSLINQHLIGVPNNHLYDGKTSVYDLARMSFGGTIALREHFRCVPDIIDFSNYLAYNGDIRPLRDPSSARRPHVVEWVVAPELGAERSGKANRTEARVIAALMAAALEMREYEGKTFGAITLLGDEQAQLILDLVLSVTGAVRLQQRRFLAGNAAQFQGDERDVIFLSMVDVPTGKVLPLRDNDTFKQRYNVAASRAKDQMWIVHSLEPSRDLNSADLRRRLIEHVRDPRALGKAIHEASRRAESPFEREVIQWLMAKGYKVRPQVQIGHYRIDLVVSDGRGQIAVECDGDRFHPFEQIPEDMIRQAVLERAGWRFIRIRGTRFFRHPEATMRWVAGELTRLGIQPTGSGMEQPDTSQPDVSIEKVTGRAVEIMRYQGWLPELNVDLPSEVGEEQNGVPVGAAADSFDTYGGKADGEEKDKQGAAGPTTGQRLRV